jgi:formyltetrahydrofolate hydrolase
MKAIITVLGKDQVGIIAGVSSLLAKWNVNEALRQWDFAGLETHGQLTRYEWSEDVK